MKFKSTIVGSAVMAAIFAAVSAASASESIQINLSYIGSTTGVANNATTKIAQNTGLGLAVNAANFPGGSVATAQAGLTQYNMTDPTTATVAGLKNYFAVYVNFTPGNPATDFLYGFGITVNYPSFMTPVSSTGIKGTTDLNVNKFIAFNPIDSNSGVTTWDQGPADLGILGGDLVGIGAYQDTLSSASAMLVGQPGNTVAAGDDSGYIAGKGTLVGLFALAFSSDPQGVVSLEGIPATYAAFVSGNVVADDTFIKPGSTVTVGSAVVTPEPASLGVLALGGLALLARRRKSA